MPSVLAIVSKAIFEKEAAGIGVGDVWKTNRYVSQNKALAPLAEGGDLYLVTVRPPETLWLVGVLKAPKSNRTQWSAKVNEQPVRDIDSLRSQLKFSTGAGITAKAGALGMSLQTPRVLTAEDVALLRGGTKEPARAAPAKPTAAPDFDELSSTLAALQANQAGSALVHAIAAWRKLRAPALAELVDKIAKVVDAGMGEIDGGKKEVQDKWLDIATQRRAIDLGRLLAILDETSLPNIRKRFELLGAFAPDPRLALRMLPIPPNYSYEAGPCFKMAFDIAESSGDPRVRELLNELLAKTLVKKKGDSTGWVEYIEKHARRAKKVRDALPESVAVPAAVKARLAECMAACKKLSAADEASLIAQSAKKNVDTELDTLLAAVLAHPDDDHTRSVYADALQERGDPRGEFIALQLAKTDEKRQRKLLDEHGRDWIAPLDAAIKPDSIRFARGFLDACRVEWKTPKQRQQLVGHPLWSTVTELDCADMDFALDPVFKALRYATLTPMALETLSQRDGTVTLEGLIGPLVMSYGIRMRQGMFVGRKNNWGSALDVGALRNLRSLQLCSWGSYSDDDHDAVDLTPSAMAWLLDSKLGSQLSHLDLLPGRDAAALSEWIDFVAERGLAVRLRFTNANTASGSTNILVTLDLARRDKHVDVTMTFNHDMVDIRYLSIARQIKETFANLPNKSAPSITVRYNGSKKRTQPGFPSIADDIRRAFPNVTLE